jgi:hypothetical protein
MVRYSKEVVDVSLKCPAGSPWFVVSPVFSNLAFFLVQTDFFNFSQVHSCPATEVSSSNESILG